MVRGGNDDVDIEFNEHVRHRQPGDYEASAARGDAAQMSCYRIVDRFAVRALKKDTSSPCRRVRVLHLLFLDQDL